MHAKFFLISYASSFFFVNSVDFHIILCYSNRIPEAALMARSYLPSKVSEIVAIWRNDLNKVLLVHSLAIFVVILTFFWYSTFNFSVHQI